MEGTNEQEPVFEGKEAHQEGEVRDNERRVDSRLTNPDYTRSREAWKRYLAGEWTASELEEYLRGDEKALDTLTDIFGGTEC